MVKLLQLVGGYGLLGVALLGSSPSSSTPSSACLVSAFAPSGGAVRPTQKQDQQDFVFQLPSLRASSVAEESSPSSQTMLKTFISQNLGSMVLAAATFSTYLLNNHANWGPILSSSAVGLLASITLPEKLALAAVCGSFAGMARAAVIPTPAAAALQSLVCAAVLRTFDQQKWFIGFGGRLGFVAQCACTLQFLLQTQLFTKLATAFTTAAFGTTAATVRLVEPSVYNTAAGALSNLPLLVLATTGGAFFMRFWKHSMKTRVPRLANTATAVSITGLLASSSSSIAGPVFCGSFVAMAGPKILPNLRALFVAAGLAGIGQWAMAGVLLGGWGGRLGTAAFLGVSSYRIAIQSWEWILRATSRSSAATAKEA